MFKNNLAYFIYIVLLLPINLQAASINFINGGTYATSSTASNCTELTCVDGPGFDGGDILSHTDTGITNATSSETTYANARASADLSGPSYLPTLRVETIADPTKGAYASAYGIQQYTYTGLTDSTFTLDYNLHGSVGIDSIGEQLRVDVAVLIGDTPFAWDTEFDFFTNLFEVAYPLEPVDYDSLFITDGNDVNVPGSMSFFLNPGDTFYILASMGAKATNGFVDGWNTFNMNFIDDTGLVASTGPIVSQIPVPAAAWLFGSALLGFAGFNRRKKS